MIPKIGLNYVPLHHSLLVEGGRLAEQLGFEGVWLGEHIITPFEDDSRYPGEKLPFTHDSPFLEPLVVLGALAVTTRRLRLGTGVLMAPVRDPFLTARELATVDALSDGRLDVGLGLGWSREEYAILGRDWHKRGKRMDEFVHVLRALFDPDVCEFHGELLDMPKMGFAPRSPQGLRPPLHLGGHTPRALQRAALLGDGWYGGSAAVKDAAQYVDTITRHRLDAGLSMEGYQFSVVLLHRPTRGELETLSAAGVHRAVITPWRRADGPAHPGEFDDLDPVRALAKEIGLGE
ncbi:TIGR03619 family F420-dependent LLM class oxidoreductase [Streptomyces mexicanus]|uniref:TIGR03619 family F420-dependent LLM class oxidoreductase n=1 Tax=Streptomyces mexicanus TaxID=178566 RepID=A0A7X1HXH6_9ACTN|nr:TIGR03619 family F420-dependent LLM class oxidoreductase [Streptomyces mexicanus]MBC2865009.1 TIGR03619 family F420-dependent LLM class oxidoreductase [Streptomyces mexicanus]